MAHRWSSMDDAELNDNYQEAQIERDKEEEDRNYSDQDINDMEEEINERDN